jgi:internalin A
VEFRVTIGKDFGEVWAMERQELLDLIDRAAAEEWRELDLAGLGLTELPREIGKCRCLEKLDLGRWDQDSRKVLGNRISVLPEELWSLSNLQYLSIRNNKLIEIPEAISQLSNLSVLALIENQIGEIPAIIGQLSNLSVLALSNNEISEIPAIIGQLSNLSVLALSNNEISEIPATIGQLSNLSVLALSNNEISEIPATIGQLSNLSKLYLDNNEISEIPAAIGQLPNLSALYLNRNEIREIPVAIGRLPSLSVLDLSNNEIMEIPVAIGQLSNLSMLCLSNNEIREIPVAIGQLSNLSMLYLSGNLIREIPVAIGQLSSLSELYLIGNLIKEIPAAIGQLSNLSMLYLRHNQISEIPEFIEALPKLQALDLRWNPVPIFPELLGSEELWESPGSPQDLFAYLRQLRSGEVLPLNEAKVLLVGEAEVGKTCVRRSLRGEPYDPTEPQTDGLEIIPWQIHVNAKDIRLNLWDFGGQDIYHATHQFFLTKRSLYLLVADCRASEDKNNLEYWLKLIASFGGDAPVIIIGNKSDEQPLDLNRSALQKKYPNIKAILETSCSTGKGITELRQAISSEIAKLKEVYDLLPLSWFIVKDQLENMAEDIITEGRYATICAAQNITAEKDQKQLLGLLHNLGTVLNFDDHPILKSTNILNPHWVTEGIYALLSDDTLKKVTKGILTYPDLTRILDPQKYPADRHYCLTALMSEFQLCFPVADYPTPTFLIPGILPKEEPPNINLGSDTLNFQYHYRVLPNSIIARFIVLSHEKIHKSTYWRSGVMLAYQEGPEIRNLACITSDPIDHKIFITINGHESSKRSFLALIRDTFTKIHRSFKNLELTEWVPVPGHPAADPLDYQELLGLEAMGERTIKIGKLRKTFDLRELLDGYESIEQRRKSQTNESKYYEDMREIALKAVERPINNIAEANNMSSKQTNKFEGGNFSGIIAPHLEGNAKIEGNEFTQNNNPDTAEILELIASLRQAASQLPLEIQEQIIIDIDDVAAEAQKPVEQRSIPRLKRSLLALGGIAATVGHLAHPIAGLTEFTNTALELAEKFHINLPELAAQLHNHLPK